MQQVKMFDGMSSSGKVVAFLAECLRPKKCGAGAVIVARGDSTSTEMYFIREGEAEVSIELDQSGFAVLGPGRAFGEAALLTDEPRNSFVVAKTTMRLYVLTKDDLQKAFADFPGLEEVLKSPLDEQKTARLAQLEAAATTAAEAAANEEELMALIQDPEEPAQEVLAGYTLFEVEQDCIRRAPREVLLGLGPMNVCVFEPTIRSPIAYYQYDELDRWDYSANTLTFTLESAGSPSPSAATAGATGHAQRAGRVRRQRRHISFETLQGEKICQQLTETSREGWAAFVPTLAADCDEADERKVAAAAVTAASRAAGEDTNTQRQRRRQAMLLPETVLHIPPDDAASPRLIFAHALPEVCGREGQLPIVLARMLELLTGDSLRAHGIFQDDVRSLAGMAFAVKRVRQLVDGSLDGRVVDGWETACQQAPSQVLASLVKQYLRDLPGPLFPYNKCVPLGVVLMEQRNPVDSEDVEGHQRAAVLKEQVALRLADGLQACELLLAVKLFHMLSETAIVSSVNGMTTAKLAIAMETVITWRDEHRSVAPHLSNFNDSAAIRALLSYLIIDAGQMFVLAAAASTPRGEQARTTLASFPRHGSLAPAEAHSLAIHRRGSASSTSTDASTTSGRGKYDAAQRLERRQAEEDIAQMGSWVDASSSPLLQEMLDDDAEHLDDEAADHMNRSAVSNDSFMLEHQRDELELLAKAHRLRVQSQQGGHEGRPKGRLRLSGQNFFEDDGAPLKQGRQRARADQDLVQQLRKGTQGKSTTAAAPGAARTRPRVPLAFDTDSDHSDAGCGDADVFPSSGTSRDYLDQYRRHLQGGGNAGGHHADRTGVGIGRVANGSEKSGERRQGSGDAGSLAGGSSARWQKKAEFMEFDDFMAARIRSKQDETSRDDAIRKGLQSVQRGAPGSLVKTDRPSRHAAPARRRAAAPAAVDLYWGAMPETSDSDASGSDRSFASTGGRDSDASGSSQQLNLLKSRRESSRKPVQTVNSFYRDT
eukprot:SAG22_NODE_2119_length_2982_cov_1.743670_1_plen_994_part_11